MRIKKGFTLAEILIVLMVIGVIAMLTIPSMMKGVNEAQLKAGYKKAYNTVVNVAAMERVSGGLPSKATASQAADFFAALKNNLSVKYYVSNSVKVNSGDKISSNSNEVTSEGTIENDIDAQLTDSGITGDNSSPWIVTEDGIAYTILLGDAGSTKDCGTKAEINAAADAAGARGKSCLVVIADVNGLAKSPNSLEKQKHDTAGSTLGVNVATSGSNLFQLVGDQYPIYVGQDGATSGPMGTTVTGRIVSDMK